MVYEPARDGALALLDGSSSANTARLGVRRGRYLQTSPAALSNCAPQPLGPPCAPASWPARTSLSRADRTGDLLLRVTGAAGPARDVLMRSRRPWQGGHEREVCAKLVQPALAGGRPWSSAAAEASARRGSRDRWLKAALPIAVHRRPRRRWRHAPARRAPESTARIQRRWEQGRSGHARQRPARDGSGGPAAKSERAAAGCRGYGAIALEDPPRPLATIAATWAGPARGEHVRFEQSSGWRGSAGMLRTRCDAYDEAVPSLAFCTEASRHVRHMVKRSRPAWPEF